MALRTWQEYLESVRDDRIVYVDGKRVKDVTRDHPGTKGLAAVCASDYKMALDPRYHDLLVDKVDGEEVSFVFVAPRSGEDLMRRRQIIQTTARLCLGSPGGAKFTGIDGLNGLAVISWRMDNQLGTNYAERLENYRKFCQKSDPAMALAMTDAKGDRSLRPSRQKAHPDYYLRIVDRGSDGIVVRGCKIHISGAACCNEMIVLPCRAMSEEDKDYAVAFALPLNAKGVTLIGNADTGVHAMVVFDDVFVPMERVFLAGEWPFAGELAYMFGNYHRLSADSYKYMQLEIMVGLAALLAEYNGLENVSHVRDKLAWLAMYAEGTEALGKAAAQNCVIDPESGLAYPNILYSNVAKFFFADNYHQAEKHLQDITGGIAATLPSLADLENPETRLMVEKYLGGKDGIPTEHRIRAIQYAQQLTSSEHGVTTIHAEGSLAAQRITLWAMEDWDRFKAAAKRAIGIETDHPDFAQLPPFPMVEL